jgi:O-antigen/teichoic acid export membrane protein
LIAVAGCGLLLGSAAIFAGWLMPYPLAMSLVCMAIALLMEPFSLATEAHLHRQLSFRLPAIIAALRTAADGSTAIALAMLGWGAPALAMGVLVSHLVATGLLLALGGAERRVWPRPSLRGMAQFGGFGRRLTLIKLAPDLTDLVLISGLGAIAGASTTGLFNRVQVIHRMVDRTLFEGITPVVLPAISNALAGGAPRDAVYLTKVDLLMAICWPGYAMIALLADPLVSVMLGDQWDAAVMPVRVLAGMGLFLPFSKMSVSYFTAIDELPFYLRMQIHSQIARLALGLAGASISLEAFCAAVVAGSAVKALQLAFWTRRNFGGGHYRSILTRAAIITLVTLCAPATVVLWGGVGPLPTLLLALPLAAAGWLAALRLTKHLLYDQAREAAGTLLRSGRAQPG